MSAQKPVRMAVIGSGFGSAFPWHKHPNARVEAISDLRPQRREQLAKTYQCNKAYDSLESVLGDKDVDAVAVFTGAPDHVKHSVAALRAGKHVISAVPAAMSLDEAHELRETVEQTGLNYMMAETSYYYQAAISARKFYQEGKFGNVYYTEAEYHHDGLETLFHDELGRTWRYGFPPIHYPTHSTAFLVGVTGERLASVSCIGWGDDSPILKDNRYNNPFWNETAFFKTDRGNAMRVAVWWKGAHRGCERAQWYGEKMSFFMHHPHGLDSLIVRSSETTETDDAGFTRRLPAFESYMQTAWWQSDMLPPELRYQSGHDSSHNFLVHEFIDSIRSSRSPAVNIYEALAFTVPGIVAHQSALRSGEQMNIPSFDRRTGTR